MAGIHNVLAGGASAFLFSQIITFNTTEYSLRAVAINAGWDGINPLNATISINSGVFVSSRAANIPAFLIDNIPSGSKISITNAGSIVGMGGTGGAGGQFAGSTGGVGGSAFSTNYLVTLTNTGTIAGGGGGGGGGGGSYINTGVYAGGGGGGGGRSGASSNSTGGIRGPTPSSVGNTQAVAGSAGTSAAPGTGGAGGFEENGTNDLFGGAGGVGGEWGSSGGPAGAGSNGSGTASNYAGGTGGAGGAAVIGNSNITWINTGTILGTLT